MCYLWVMIYPNALSSETLVPPLLLPVYHIKHTSVTNEALKAHAVRVKCGFNEMMLKSIVSLPRHLAGEEEELGKCTSHVGD